MNLAKLSSVTDAVISQISMQCRTISAHNAERRWTAKGEKMTDLISKGALLNMIGTQCHYDTEHPLEAYGKVISTIVNMPTISLDEIKERIRVKERSQAIFSDVMDELRID